MSRTSPDTPVKKSEIFGWCCFDFANSSFTTIIITVVYSVYFQNVVAAHDPAAASWWGLALALSQLVVILISPVIGAMSDVRANKKTFLMMTSGVCSLATASLYFVGPGEVALALGLVVLANLAFSLSENICGGFLPEISTPETSGRISGYGWSFGYFGGLLSLVFALMIIKSGEGRVPLTFLMTGAFFLLASLPTLLLLRERAVPRPLAPGQSLVVAALKENFGSLGQLSRHRTLSKFFISLTFFTAGLVAVVAFAAVYAAKVLKMEQGEIIGLFVVLQLAGVAGAFGFGFIQDRAGAKTALVLSLALWIVVCVWGGLCQAKTEFYAIGVLAGIAMGSLQSAGRAVVSSLTPPGRSGEFFGYWGFFSKLAGVVGPPVFGFMATHFAGLLDPASSKLWPASLSYMLPEIGFRAAILGNSVFFIVGILLLLPLDLRKKAE